MAVIHCLTGKGRTATVLSALVCWLDIEIDIDTDVGQGPGGRRGTPTTMQVRRSPLFFFFHSLPSMENYRLIDRPTASPHTHTRPCST